MLVFANPSLSQRAPYPELTLRLRRSRAEQSPVQLVTDHNGLREMCLQAGMDDLVNTPLSLSGIQELLAQWLKKPEPEMEIFSTEV